MKPQTLPTSIEYGFMLSKKLDLKEINLLQYCELRNAFDTKIMQPPTIADFIPSVYENGVWKPIESPNPTSIGKCINKRRKLYEPIYNEEEVAVYQTALNNVKFSGWEHDGETSNIIFVVKNDIDMLLVFDKKTGIVQDFNAYSDLTTLNPSLTERGMEDFNINI